MCTETELPHDEALNSLGIVVAEVANDFTKTLSLITSYVDMALGEIPKGERAYSDLEHALASSNRMNAMMASIITFNKKTKLPQKEISLNKAIHSVLFYLKDHCPPNINIISEITTADMLVISNETEIFHVINNVCTNSIQAINGEEGEIKIKLDHFTKKSTFYSKKLNLDYKNYARISIKDTGCGMDVNTISHIYDPFFSHADMNSTSGNQAGLGLTIARNIVRSQNGFIHADSSAGKGTTFDICLPLLH
ncbi:MAG: hypothetical protein COA71_09400 [SAR86 cluster bacterium]|uniref:histidine kinase n=1 Tax=SAR86 cluster bacterium TaxID=2030880 RepID=A0A2A5CAC9_9GAMM|nr:MAG: hypothetical protein COA71_09400 [SAR86 cluster bacterium]